MRGVRVKEVAVDFAELCVQSNFSFLEGASHPEELAVQAHALGLSALAIADRNTLAGVVRAHVAAKELGLRLVIGARLEFLDAPSVVCLPTDRAAYGRLSRLLSLGQQRAPKGECHLKLADLAAHAEGQIMILIPPVDWSPDGTHLDDEVARFKMGAGATALYLLASYGYRGQDRERLSALAAIAQRQGVPLLASNRARYHVPTRKRLADVLTCVRHGLVIKSAGFHLDANAERHLKSADDMMRLFKDYPEAVPRTMDVARQCRFSLDDLVYEYPDEPSPTGVSHTQYLADLTWAGAHNRFPGGIPAKVTQTLHRELGLIGDLNYVPYFLTVYDIVTFARSRDILCQGRGSAANSVVCYCLGITSVNPTEVDLLFERFITPERREPPDIDVDFEHERREEVIQYIYRRYGRDRAGLAATVISYRARSAVRDVGKVMGLSEDTVTALAGMVWGSRSGGSLPENYVREAGLNPDDPLLATVLELAEELIGFPRHLSQHVGGFVLTRGPLVEVVPIGNGGMENRTFIEWDKNDIAALGLLKVDILALGMLTCIHRAFDLITTHYGHQFTLANIPREDSAVYDMLCRADSVGVFQVESRAQMNMLPRLKPRTFYDLVIEVAIVRPGPIQGDMVHPYLRRRSGVEAEQYPAPALAHGPPDELRQILGKTKGVPLFQEQAMRIAMVAARFSDAEVNELRKSMATFRKRGTIGLLEEKMVSRMVSRGYDPAFAERCFNQIKGFGEYGFPESHAASFALLVYVSAWLKCHYPEVFACALLNSQPMGFYAPAQIVRDARDHGVVVEAVDVSASAWDCTLERETGGESNGQSPLGRPPAGLSLRLGLRQIDGLGQAEAEKVVAVRTGGQDQIGQAWINGGETFKSVANLMEASGIRRGALDKIAAGDALRSLGLDRREALWETQALASKETLPLFAWSDTRDVGQEPSVTLAPMPLSEHVVNDYQTLRLSLKAHPMSFVRPRLDSLAGRRVVSASALVGLGDGATVSVAGLVLVRQRPGSANGVVFMTIEDETGVANAVIWPKTLERFRRVIMGARLIVIHGRIQRHESIIHVVSQRLEDRSDWLGLLVQGCEAMTIPIANADEGGNLGSDPETGPKSTPDSERDHYPRFAHKPRAMHPRDERIVPKSRDFH
jgi:error-prone DNA polymerase